MSLSKARANEFERTLATTDCFNSGHLQHECERPDMERKYLNSNKAQRIDPKLTRNNHNQWNVWCDKYTKQSSLHFTIL